jgi:hypothetical protein
MQVCLGRFWCSEVSLGVGRDRRGYGVTAFHWNPVRDGHVLCLPGKFALNKKSGIRPRDLSDGVEVLTGLHERTNKSRRWKPVLSVQ